MSDKAPGPELDLAPLSLSLWRELAEELPADIEFDPKGGLVVAAGDASPGALSASAEEQRASGVEAYHVTPDRLRDVEPHLAPGLAGGTLYPQDCQVQPALAAARLLHAVRRAGALFLPGEEVLEI